MALTHHRAGPKQDSLGPVDVARISNTSDKSPSYFTPTVVPAQLQYCNQPYIMEPSSALPGRHDKWFTCWTPAPSTRTFKRTDAVPGPPHITLASVLAARAASPAWPGKPAAMIMQSDAIASNYKHPAHRSSGPRSKNKRKLRCQEPKTQDKKKTKLGKSNDSVVVNVRCPIPRYVHSHLQSL